LYLEQCINRIKDKFLNIGAYILRIILTIARTRSFVGFSVILVPGRLATINIQTSLSSALVVLDEVRFMDGLILWVNPVWLPPPKAVAWKRSLHHARDACSHVPSEGVWALVVYDNSEDALAIDCVEIAIDRSWA